MLKMLTSASRLVLIVMTITLCIGLFLQVVDSKDFMIIAGMVFAFYFTKPIDKSTDEFIK